MIKLRGEFKKWLRWYWWSEESSKARVIEVKWAPSRSPDQSTERDPSEVVQLNEVMFRRWWSFCVRIFRLPFRDFAPLPGSNDRTCRSDKTRGTIAFCSRGTPSDSPLSTPPNFRPPKVSDHMSKGVLWSFSQYWRIAIWAQPRPFTFSAYLVRAFCDVILIKWGIEIANFVTNVRSNWNNRRILLLQFVAFEMGY